MSVPMILAHISDLHVSTFGESFHDRSRYLKRATKPMTVLPDHFEIRWAEKGWRILSEKTHKPREADKETLILLDDADYKHNIPTINQKTKKSLLHRMINYARKMESRRAKTLATHPPTSEELTRMFLETPYNSNLRFLRAARAVIKTHPDLIVITGDITDNGDGYELIESVFAPWIQTGRLLAIPGNHDRFLFPFRGAARPKPTWESNQANWHTFAHRIGLELDDSGAWVKYFPECKSIFVGFDSCALGQSRFLLHSGAIGPEQMAFLHRISKLPMWKEAQHRFVLMHHHLVTMSYGVGRNPPTEIGMKLVDAVEVARTLNQVGASMVLHGHRHVSEARQLPGCHFQLLAAPSLIMGCHSGDPPSLWQIELGKQLHWRRIYIDLPPIKPQAKKERPLTHPKELISV